MAEILHTFNKSNLLKYKFGKISREQSKVWFFAIWWAPLVQNHLKFQLKSTEELSLMTLKSDAKYKEKLTCGFKWYEEFGKFLPSYSKVWKFYFNELFLSKVYKIWAKKHRGIIFRDTAEWCKTWINPNLVVSKMVWKIGWAFIRTLKNLKNCTLMGFLWAKHTMFQLESFKGIMCHDTNR